MIHVMARIDFKPEAAQAAADILRELVEATRHEPGCISYQLFQRPDAPHVFQTVEQWSDQAALDGHMGSPHIAAAMTSAGSLFARPPEILSFAQLM